MIEYLLKAFAAFFSIINPMGIMPVFMSMTVALSISQRRKVATKATFIAFIVLILFALAGEYIFRFFSITPESFRIVGGIIFFMVGWEMLQARQSRTKFTPEEQSSYMDDITITPLAVPMIAGPGAITNSIIFWEEATAPEQKIGLVGVVFLVLFLVWISLVGAGKIMSYMGDTGNKIMLRLMGMIVMVIAVEFFFSGLLPMLGLR